MPRKKFEFGIERGNKHNEQQHIFKRDIFIGMLHAKWEIGPD